MICESGDCAAAYVGLGASDRRFAKGRLSSLKYLGLVGSASQAHTGLLNLNFEF